MLTQHCLHPVHHILRAKKEAGQTTQCNRGTIYHYTIHPQTNIFDNKQPNWTQGEDRWTDRWFSESCHKQWPHHLLFVQVFFANARFCHFKRLFQKEKTKSTVYTSTHIQILPSQDIKWREEQWERLLTDKQTEMRGWELRYNQQNKEECKPFFRSPTVSASTPKSWSVDWAAKYWV